MIYKILLKQTSLFILGARVFVYLTDVVKVHGRCTLTSVHLIFEALKIVTDSQLCLCSFVTLNKTNSRWNFYDEAFWIKDQVFCDSQ